MTFSVVAFDPEGPAWGVAVASKALCVGAHVPWGRAGAGAVATQAWHDLRYGWEGLALLERGATADLVVRELVAGDPEAVFRQLGVVDHNGEAATHSGWRCMPWAGGVAGQGFAAQGNLLAGPQVVGAMAEAYRSATGPLAARLVAALIAGDEAGGDRRGRQSAAVRVWGGSGVPEGLENAAVDLRVDDHPRPAHELPRLLALHHLHYRLPVAADLLPVDQRLAVRVAAGLRRRGHDPEGPGGLAPALARWAFEENLEHRLAPDGVDRLLLAALEGDQPLATSISG